jgi:hypothetical protein
MSSIAMVAITANSEIRVASTNRERVRNPKKRLADNAFETTRARRVFKVLSKLSNSKLSNIDLLP